MRFPCLLPQNHYGIGNSKTPIYAFFRNIQTIALYFSFSLLLERVGYAYLMSEKVSFDTKGKTYMLLFHHFYS